MTRRAILHSDICPTAVPRTGVVLTGFWRIKTMVDVAMANDLYYRAMALRVNLVVPILHLQDDECWHHLAEALRSRAVVWRTPLQYSALTQRACMEAIADSAGCQWVWEADLDERLMLEDLAKTVSKAESQGADYIPGEWVDCFRSDGTLAPVATNRGRREADLWGVLPSVPMEDQFPARGYLTRDFARACPTKVALHRYDCLTTGGNHCPREATKRAANFTLPILHFKWHEAMLENAQQKSAAAKERGQPWFAEQERCLEIEEGKIPARFLGAVSYGSQQIQGGQQNF